MEHALQAIVIENAIVDTFCSGALFVDLLISICATGNIGVKTDIPFGPSLDDPAISGVHAAVFAFGTVPFPIGAAPHEITAGTVVTIGLHAQFFLAQRCAILVNGDGIRNCFWPSAFVVQVNKCMYPSAFKDTVGGVVVHC